MCDPCSVYIINTSMTKTEFPISAVSLTWGNAIGKRRENEEQILQFGTDNILQELVTLHECGLMHVWLLMSLGMDCNITYSWIII